MSYLKFGFHTGAGGFGVPRSFYQLLDAAGVPFFAKGADGFPFDAQEIARASSVPHTVVFRRSVVPPGGSPPPSGNPDVPEYHLPPVQAAARHWAWHMQHLPVEFDPGVCWLETINEVDKNRAEWLAEFALATAELARADGIRWAAFGFSTGEPEPEHWSGPAMRQFLALCAAHPDRLAIALHEYSLTTAHVSDGRLVGRFRDVLEVNPAVRILITEWGWTHDDVPMPSVAMQHYLEAGELYARYPQVAGAATWYLGPGFGDIRHKTAALVNPLISLTLGTVFPDPKPPTRHTAVVVKLPQEAMRAEWIEVASYAYDFRHTVTASTDDMMTVLSAGNERSYAKIYQPGQPSQAEAIARLVAAGIRWEELSLVSGPPPTRPYPLTFRPCVTSRITQRFGENPAAYADVGLPGHDGLDYAVGMHLPFYAVADGRVVWASDRRWSSDEPSGYGWHVVLDHGDFCTVYAHATPQLPLPVGADVRAGQVVAYSGNTGNSTGPHLHFGILSKSDTGNGYPLWRFGQPVDPEPHVASLLSPAFDLLPYFNPLLTHGPMHEVRHPSGATETFQVQDVGNGRFLLVKNGQWEEFAYDADYIWRGRDTSPGPAPDYAERPGVPRYYRQAEPNKTVARWCRRWMAPGETFTGAGHHVQFYYKDTCGESAANSGHATNHIRLVAAHVSMTWNGVRVPDVIELTNGAETWFFARNRGLVAWESDWGQSAVSQFLTGRPNLVPESGCFSN